MRLNIECLVKDVPTFETVLLEGEGVGKLGYPKRLDLIVEIV